MQVELVEVLEYVRADVTPILLVLMRACVGYELVKILKQLSTSSHNALVSFLLLVAFEMSFELGILVMALLAIGTLVAGGDDGLVPRLFRIVILNILQRLLGKSLVPQRPDLVGRHVLLDIGLLGEPPATDQALEGLLPGVRPHVLLQVEVLAEALVTVATEQLVGILFLLLI